MSGAVAMIELGFVIPGDIMLRTGGYIYDRHVMAALPNLGIKASHVALSGSYPYPPEADLAETARILARQDDDTPLLIDGLAFGAFPASLAAGIRAPIIALVHHPLFLETGLTEAQQKHFHALEKAALGFARHVVTTSATTAQTVAQEFAVPADRITVAEPGTERGDRAPMRDLAAGEPVELLAVGSVVPRKAYRDLVAALGMLADLPWRLTIAGDDTRHVEESQALKQAVAASPVGSRIVLRGALSNAALADLYVSSDAFVMSSLYEGYGMVLGEALAHGLPIVATRAGAAAETVPDAAALKVAPGDVNGLAAALRHMISDAALRHRLADDSWTAGQRLPQWIDTARRIATVVERVTRERP
jgi:glycosyltransferase involved in cell wall biosynthesis